MKHKIKTILFVGGGYASCCLARMVNDCGYRAIIFERSNTLGGMARSFQKSGMTYEFGPHIIADHGCSKKAINFITRYIRVLPTVVEATSILQGKFLNFPPYRADFAYLKEYPAIQRELLNIPKKADESNFESYLISRVGYTLYQLYFRTFTEKFWQINPKNFSASWAKLRHLGESIHKQQLFFNRKWCTYPVSDFNELFTTISTDIEVHYQTEIAHIDLYSATVTDSKHTIYKGDLVVSTIGIDRLFKGRYGMLDYAGYHIEPVIIEKEYFHPINPKTGRHYGMAYYPEKIYPYSRITEYKSFNHKADDPAFDGRTIITVETPNRQAKFYPFMDKKNERKFRKYLHAASKYKRLVTIGRLGLYKYTTLDTTTDQALHFMQYFPQWITMTSQQRYDNYLRIRGSL